MRVLAQALMFVGGMGIGLVGVIGVEQVRQKFAGQDVVLEAEMIARRSACSYGL